MNPIQLDGAYGEGGGQILRTGVALAALTGEAVLFERIRAGRTKPGLQPQHLAAVRAAASLCAAELSGDVVGSQQLLFTPRTPVRADRYRIDIGTAGAVPLVLQTVLLPLALAGTSRVTITGGTHVPHAPTAEYLAHVYLPALARAGVRATLAMPSAGFYPRGGGEMTAEITPARLQPFDLTARGKINSITAHILTANLPAHVGERGAETAARLLKRLGIPGTRVSAVTAPSNGPGAAITIAVACAGGGAGFTSLGERGKPMERVVEEAVIDLQRWLKTTAACDAHLADQIVLPAALSGGECRWTAPAATEHLRTVLWVARHFRPLVTTIMDQDDGTVQVSVRPGG
jgi:RNA 3'-terminal phosphate cyclase (ATP)